MGEADLNQIIPQGESEVCEMAALISNKRRGVQGHQN